MYMQGTGVAKDDAEAVRWYRKAADQGDSVAQLYLGMRYSDGKGVPKDAAMAASWYRKAAEQGDAGAQGLLGDAYYNGDGVTRDLVEAAKWFRKAADQGDANSQHDLGVCYANGQGVEKDAVEAAKWYRKAAEQGVVMAQFNLGLCYNFGNGVKVDLVEAAKWFRKAADQGDTDAQHNLGLCYHKGDGVEKDYAEAVKWYRKAAEQGNAGAQYDIGVCYQNGEGVKKDLVESAKWYRKAAEQGDSNSQYNLGADYMHGNGVTKDLAESARWFRKAAEQGDPMAQNNLGHLYLLGVGVMANNVEGLAWIYVSSANGDEKAAEFMTSQQNRYNDETLEAARQRATEIQAQIASNSAPATVVATIIPSASTPNRPKASGSGALISTDGLILTAAHVVQGASRIEVITPAGKFVATVVKVDTTNDIVLLKCNGVNFTPLPVAPSKEARAGKSVFTVGFPNIQLQGSDPKLTKGEISSQNGFQDDPTEWQISVPIQPGNSGGPLCDENGNLVGIVESTLNPLTMAKIAGEIPQDVNYAVKSSYILPLLDDVQNLPPPRPSTESTKFEDVVGNVQKSSVLILVY